MIFLSHILEERSPLYGNTGEIRLVRSRQISTGDTSNNTELSFPAHGGTHADAPYHFDPDGTRLEELPAEFWISTHPYLLEAPAEPEHIFSLEEWLPMLKAIPKETDLLLIKTGFERYREQYLLDDDTSYIFHGPGISPEIGFWMRRNLDLKMIGFDFISVTAYTDRICGREAHRAFLGALAPEKNGGRFNSPIVIIEDMKLSGLSRSPSRVIVSPLRYADADGAPVTVFAELV